MHGRNLSLPKVAGKRKANETVKQRFKLYNRWTPNGTTKLHRLLQAPCSPAELRAYLIYLDDKKKASKKAQTADNNGMLPMDAIPASVPDAEYVELYGELFKHTVANTLPPASKLIDEEQVLQQFANPANQEIHATLRMACRAANNIRSLRLPSSTHPDANVSLSDAAILKLDNVFKKARLQDKFDRLEWKQTSENRELDEYAKLKHSNTLYRDIYCVANCLESSYLVVEEIERLTPAECVVEVAQSPNGDHAFVVINRDPESDINQPETWGQNAVICDAWAGKVYPACEYANHLACFAFGFHPERNRLYNIVYFYNAAFHKMEVIFKNRFGTQLDDEVEQRSLRI